MKKKISGIKTDYEQDKYIKDDNNIGIIEIYLQWSKQVPFE